MAKDLFSKQAAAYARWRPGYPKELIEYIVSFVPRREVAWDCATGNGQAAVMLAAYFDKVLATDLSNEQLKFARPHAKVIYSQGAAENTDFTENTFDLITVAQAYHWFDHKAFCKEAKRIAKDEAVVAVWGYDLCRMEHEAVNDLLTSFYRDVTGPYWDAARKYVDERYRTVYFDFEEISVESSFSIYVEWGIEDMRGYLNSWSAVQKFISVNSYNPVDEFIKKLKDYWGDIMKVEFPLFLRIGNVDK
jgi:ubiquinone/menaquinone biosynthesis C-methylase UbiE